MDRILDDFDSTSGTIFKADPAGIPDPILSVVDGCHGNALALGYDLTNVAPDGQSWIVLRRSFSAAQNLTPFTHIRLAIRGSNINSHDTVEVKLLDGAGQLHAIPLKSLADLPVWRPIYIDLRELTGDGGLNLANITDFEIGIVRCVGCEMPDNPSLPSPAEQHFGTLYLDEFAAVNLKPAAVNRLVEAAFETVRSNPAVLADTASALRNQIVPCGSVVKPCDPGMDLIPAWFPETSHNFNTYVQAEALLVFVYEFERTSNPVFLDVAQNLATKLLSLQIPSGRTHAGAWYTSRDGMLGPPHRALPKDQPPLCDGDETMVQDPDDPQHRFVATNIDACEWVGNVGWVLIALGKLQRSGFYNSPIALKEALDRGATWITNQSEYRRNTPDPNPQKTYPNLISLGTEGNISAYFGLRAAGRKAEAALLGNAIFRFGWDPVQRRMRPGVGAADFATALDVSGSWGVTFLRSIGKTQEALDSQGYAASVLRICSFSESICGYGDIAGPYTVAVEFTAQSASAGILGAEFVMQQLYPLQRQPPDPFAGAFPGATDHWFGGRLLPWNTTMPGVSPTAWVYFASNIDPLKEVAATFGDVPMDDPFFTWIEALFAAGITGGCSTTPPQYCPDAAVTRAQMAVFLVRGIHGAAFVPPPATGIVFTDVPASHPFGSWIEQLFQDGITGGCATNPPQYCPDATVTRAQMAVFLVRAEHGAAYQPSPATGTIFGDVPASDLFAPWIEQLAREGITGGCGGGNYCPTQAVTRGQMAVFLVRTFNFPPQACAQGPINIRDSRDRDLDHQADDWGVYCEGASVWRRQNVANPSLDGESLQFSIRGGASNSTAHFYRIFTSEPLAMAFMLSASFRFTPTTCNNAGGPSLIQAVEFSMSKFWQNIRWEFALQWENVAASANDGAPQWRYWDGFHWVRLSHPVPQCLEGDQWHEFTIVGQITDGQVHYERFVIDGQVYSLDITVSPVPANDDQRDDRLAIGVQLDSNLQAMPYDVFVDKVNFFRLPVSIPPADARLESADLPVRRECRWYSQEGGAACTRCPGITTVSYDLSPAVRAVSGLPVVQER